MNSSITLENLQTALGMELTAAHQYQLHAHVFDEWGLDRLATKMREEMHEELGHSDEYLSRIFFLNGEPKLEFAKPPQRFSSLREMFEADLADEKNAISFYARSAVQAAKEGDIGSRALFERVALDEEAHMAWLGLQLSLIERLGEQAYAAKQVSSLSAETEN